MFRFGYSVLLCFSVYCLCVNVYCTTSLGVNPIAAKIHHMYRNSMHETTHLRRTPAVISSLNAQRTKAMKMEFGRENRPT